MNVDNKGEEAFDFQAALHSYFTVSALDQLEIAGSFEGKEFLNKMAGDGGEMQTEDRSAITIGEEYDRVYKGVNDPVLKDSGTGKSVSHDIITSSYIKFSKMEKVFHIFSFFDMCVCVCTSYDIVGRPQHRWIRGYRLVEPLRRRGNGIQQLCLR
jgi:hypothetical protein